MRAHAGCQEAAPAFSLSKSPSQGGRSRQSPPSASTRPSGTGGSTTERPGRASHLQHRPQDAGSSQVAGGPHWGPRAGPTGTLPGWTRSYRCHGSPPPTRKAPSGPSLLTETTVPTADDLLAWNPLPILTSKRKNQLYPPGKGFTLPLGPQHMTYACFGNGSELACFFKKCSDTVLPTVGRDARRREAELLKDDS